jgi:hypothetical protein
MYEAGNAADPTAVGCPLRFVAVVVAMALVHLCVDGMVVAQLGAVAGFGYQRGDVVADSDALEVRDEAQDEQQVVAHRQCVIARPKR